MSDMKEMRQSLKADSAGLAVSAIEVARQNPTNTRGKAAMTIYAAIFVSFLCACANGYDGSLMTAVNGMPHYQARFTNSQVGATTGIIFALYPVGSMVGSLVAAPISDIWGRRWGMFTGSVIIMIGSIIISSSYHRPQFLVGRFILGFGVAILTTGAPSYCIEICPPTWRGRATGFYNCGWYGGSIPAAAITLGTNYIQSDASWRVPFALQCVPACIVAVTIFLLPESPRWLIANQKDDAARSFLIDYHGNGNPNHPIVAAEWEEFRHDIQTSGSDKRWWDFSGLYATKNARWRTLMVIMMGVFGQFSGNGLGYYNLTIYSYVGYGHIVQFVLNLVNSIVAALGSAAGVYVSDRFSRRKILIIGTLCCAAFLAFNAGFTLAWGRAGDHPNLNIGRAAIAGYFLFNWMFGLTYTPLQALYPSECLQTNSRAKGMAFYAFGVNAVGFINTYAISIALNNIKYNTVWIFVGWDVVEAFLWYLFGVETVGKSLEELEEIFSSPYPPRAHKRTNAA